MMFFGPLPCLLLSLCLVLIQWRPGTYPKILLLKAIHVYFRRCVKCLGCAFLNYHILMSLLLPCSWLSPSLISDALNHLAWNVSSVLHLNCRSASWADLLQQFPLAVYIFSVCVIKKCLKASVGVSTAAEQSLMRADVAIIGFYLYSISCRKAQPAGSSAKRNKKQNRTENHWRRVQTW